MTSQITYIGDLRTISKHLESGVEVLSDAPKDNQGKGEAFSPTDMVANALGTCMMTIMAIKAKSLEVDLKGSTANITKIMTGEPRRIAKIIVEMNMSLVANPKTKTILERVALNCPVHLSLHPDIEKIVTFHWK